MRDIIIVGAGLIGASIAMHLARSGKSVTIIDASIPATAASGRSFGWINASFYADTHHHELRVAGIAAHHALEADLGQRLVTWSGALCWEEQGEALDAQFETLSALGYRVALLDANAVSRLEPALQLGQKRAILMPSEGAVDTGALVAALLEDAACHGAQIIAGCPVAALHREGDAVTGVVLPMGVMHAGQVVVAAGTATQAVLGTIDVDIPMLHRPGLIMRTRKQARLIRHIMVSDQGEFRQTPTGHILMSTVAGHQGDATETITEMPERLAERTLTRLQQYLPEMSGAWEAITAANRPVPKDGLPVIGAIGSGDVYVAVLHSGVTLAALVGALAAAEITGGPQAPLLAPYRPDRFSLSGRR